MSKVTIRKKAVDNRVLRDIKRLERKFPGIKGFRPGEEWFGSPDQSHIIMLGNAAEGGEIDGMPAADYSGYYVHPKLEKELKSMGMETDWYDPGTLFAYYDF